MKGPVNTTVFTDAVVVLGARVLPTGVELREGELVGSIAVNLVGTEENEDRIRAWRRAASSRCRVPRALTSKSRMGISRALS
jgi:hypothetical protein